MDNPKLKGTSSGMPQVREYSGASYAQEPHLRHSVSIPEHLLGEIMPELDQSNREKLRHLCGRGTIFSGFPGTGKGTLINYIAQKDNAVLVVVEKGDNPLIMDAKFREAKSLAESGQRVYVIFDEVDEFGSKESFGSDVEKISKLLREIDGFNTSPKTNGNLYFFATTNNLPAVDQRLMRPGRLENIVEIPLPNTEQRRDILDNLLNGLDYREKLEPFLETIARKSRGYTPADMRGLLKSISLTLLSKGSLSQDDVLQKVQEFVPTAKRGFEYFKDPQAAEDDIVGREIHLDFLKRAIQNSNSANFLLYGPNGTGKTLLPEVLANSLDINYLFVQGSELQEGIVGEGTKKIKRLIHLAKMVSPCLILIDESEGIVSRRGTISHRDDETAYLNSVLSRELNGVYVFMTTNTPHLLNETTLTRFPYRLFFELPSEEEREAYLSRYGISGINPRDLERFSFRDLENIRKISESYGQDVLHRFLTQYTPENKNRDEDWRAIKTFIGDSLELERIVKEIGGRK